MAKENEPMNAQTQTPEPPAAPSATPNRDKMLTGLRGKYGEELSEEELYGKAMEGYDADHEYTKKSKAEAAKLNALLESDENLNDFFCEMFQRGVDGHPELALAHIKPLMQQYINGEITSDEYTAEVERMKEADAKLQRIQDMAKEAFAEECQERGWDVTETMEKLNALINHDCETKEECREQVKNMFRILDFEPAIAAAETKGRNAKIVEQKRNHPAGVDTLPRNGGSSAAATAPKKTMSIFDYAEAAK